MTKKLISIVVPCFKEEESVSLFCDEIRNIFKKIDYDYELILVDDGSYDNTLKIVKEIADNDEKVIYISFSRNFGKESAIFAGLNNCNGEFVTIMDADMQDPPSLLPKMIDVLENENYDCVATKRVSRKGESKLRSFFARMFYKINNMISNVNIVDGARDFRLMKKEMVEAIVSMNEYNRFSKGAFSWVGFNTYWISYDNVERLAGKTSWSFKKLFKYAIDGIVVFTNLPLSVSLILGIIFVAIFIIVMIIDLLSCNDLCDKCNLIKYFILFGGIQLISIGILGCYISKIYDEVKNRPHYIIAKTNRKGINKIK